MIERGDDFFMVIVHIKFSGYGSIFIPLFNILIDKINLTFTHPIY